MYKYEKVIVKYVIVLVLRQFSPIQLLLFKHSRKFGRVRKFVLEKLSYIFVFDPVFHKLIRTIKNVIFVMSRDKKVPKSIWKTGWV
jgi:hypothetical protein